MKNEGACVIVGRCADYILRDNPNCMSVFIHAPFELRVERIAKKENLVKTVAESRVVKTDKKRANYYNFYTNQEWGDISNYELALDSSVLGPEGTADMILSFVKAREARQIKE